MYDQLGFEQIFAACKELLQRRGRPRAGHPEYHSFQAVVQFIQAKAINSQTDLTWVEWCWVVYFLVKSMQLANKGFLAIAVQRTENVDWHGKEHFFVNFFWALSKSQFRPTIVWRQRFCQAHAYKMKGEVARPNLCAVVLWSFANLRNRNLQMDHDYLQQLLAYLMRRLHKLPRESLAHLFWAAHTVRTHLPQGWMDCFCTVALPALPHLAPSALVSLASTAARRPKCEAAAHNLLLAILALSHASPHWLSGQQAAVLLWAAGKRRIVLRPEQFKALAPCLLPWLPTAGPEELASVVWALPWASGRYVGHWVSEPWGRDLVQQLEAASEGAIGECDVPCLLQLLDGFSRLQHVPGYGWLEQCNVRLGGEWGRLSEAQQQRVRRAMRALLFLADPELSQWDVRGGARWGVG